MAESLFTTRCTLVPTDWFNPAEERTVLGELVRLTDSDTVRHVDVPQFGAVLVYSDFDTNSGGHSDALPELFYVLQDISKCVEYNRILASYCDGTLCLAIAQGERLLLANAYRAQDFTTAQYFIFLALKSLQLNPEVSTICWRSGIGLEEEMSLYRYFKSVDILCES